MMTDPYLSIIVPCYRSSDWLADLSEQIKNVMQAQGWSYELILVNDCSPDGTWKTIQSIASTVPSVCGILSLIHI